MEVECVMGLQGTFAHIVLILTQVHQHITPMHIQYCMHSTRVYTNLASQITQCVESDKQAVGGAARVDF